MKLLKGGILSAFGAALAVAPWQASEARDWPLPQSSVPSGLPPGEWQDLNASGNNDQPLDTLAKAIADAYETNPLLAAQRYELRATDNLLGAALAQTRANVRAEISAAYQRTNPGAVTQEGRPLVDRLNSPHIQQDEVGTQLVVDQPITTGGKAAAEIAVARGEIQAAQQALRGREGDLILEVITAYADIRRDEQVLAIRTRNEQALTAILNEVEARREAGELTRTDVAQAMTQLQAAQAARNASEAQLEDSRALFMALVGREPGRLAPAPNLPRLPETVEEVFETAAEHNPELASAFGTERASRARIASARADGRPTLTLRGTTGTTGPLAHLRRDEQDVYWSGRMVLTVPLSAGGRVATNISQASDRNSADRLRIEATRRRMIQQIVSAWNQMATAQRNYAIQQERLEAARIYYEGTFEEYREGLRSTFDVLFAQNTFWEAAAGLLGFQRDQYIAAAALLRQIGELEAGKLLADAALYDPEAHLGEVERRSALLWDPLFRTIDGLDKPSQAQQPIEWPAPVSAEPQMMPATSVPVPGLIKKIPQGAAPAIPGVTAERYQQ